MSDPKPSVALQFPPIDWDASALGKEVWDAWNALEGAIRRLMCAQPHQLTERAAAVEVERDMMAMALRNRDRRAP